MKKVFNTTGTCIPSIHYMVDIKDKLDNIENMIDKGNYFVINRPRQYGKTTTIYLLKNKLKEKYLVVSCSFEGLGSETFKDEKTFSNRIIKLMAKSIKLTNKDIASRLIELSKDVNDLADLSDIITDFIEAVDQEVVLFIDEVDKSSNNQVFLNFLGVLRSKFLLRQQEEDCTFHSVILAGVYDIKNLKLKLRPDEEVKLNSPWNIAVDFNLDMSFNEEEIESMLIEYCRENNLSMNTNTLSNKLYYYTNGYPFLVSRLCQIVDETILDNTKNTWDEYIIQRAVKYILREQNTLFDDLIKNLENNNELYDLVRNIVLDGYRISFNRANPIIDLGYVCGIFTEEDYIVKLDNRIYEQFIYDYLISKIEVKSEQMSIYNYKNNFIEGEKLNLNKVIEKFQQFMKEQYSLIDSKFIEREGRLLFLAFLKPIINGVGFDFKEVQVSQEKRLDVVITYNKEKYIIELKIWRGEKYHEEGIKQLVDYLDIHGLDKGYMVVYNFNKSKEYKKENILVDGKEIFIVYV